MIRRTHDTIDFTVQSGDEVQGGSDGVLAEPTGSVRRGHPRPP